MRNFKDCEPIPFYFLNDDVNRDELILQLEYMRQNGIPAFFLHVRDGITGQAYGTDLFFRNVKFIVEEAEKRGIKMWIYDEDSYPSGNGGGKIVIDNPELRAYALKVEKIARDKSGVFRKILGKVKGLYGYVVTRDGEKTTVKKFDDCFGTVRTHWYRREMNKTYYCDLGEFGYPHPRAATCYTEIMFELEAEANAEVYCAYLTPTKTDLRYGAQADCLNRKTTDELIARVYEKYKKYVGNYFGNEIQGVFMDEPSVGGVLPYTAELAENFKNRCGRDFYDEAYKLSVDYVGDSAEFRREYVSTVKHMFLENFVSPLAKWCGENGLKFTGHFSGEEDLLSQALCGQDIYEGAKKLDMPGFDIIGKYLGDVKHPALLFGVKLISSAAAQSGKKEIVSECFALNAYNFGYYGLKRMGDWLFANGINRLVPHAFHYGYSSYRRADAGKSFFFQDAYFDEYLKFAAYAGRVCKHLKDFEKTVADTLVVLPDGALAEEIPYSFGNGVSNSSPRAKELKKAISETIAFMTENHIAYEVTETASASGAEIADGKIKIGQSEYSRVVVINGGESENAVFERFKNSDAECVLFYGDINELKTFKSDDITDGKDVLVLRKSNANGKLTFAFNNTDKKSEFILKAGENAVCYDAETDEYFKLVAENGRAVITLDGYSSITIIEADGYNAEKPFVYRPSKADYGYFTDPQWTYMPRGAVGAIDKYDLAIEKDGKKTEFNAVKFNRVREFIGTNDDIYKGEYTIPYFDTAKRPAPIYHVKAAYACEVSAPPCDGAYLLFDKESVTGDFALKWNGEEIPHKEFILKRVYDASNYAFYPKWKAVNRLEIILKNAGEFDGVTGEIYIMK